jgi:beta-xylosidase
MQTSVLVNGATATDCTHQRQSTPAESVTRPAALGRICYLEPVTWGSDDWPVFGNEGQPVLRWEKPEVAHPMPITRPATSDEFDSPGLGLQWQWNHNPVNDRWSLTKRPGFLRLKNVPADDLPVARNTLTQKLWDDAGIIDVKIDISAMTPGQHAGLAFMTGNQFGRIGVVDIAGAKQFEWDGGVGPVVSGAWVWLRGTYQGNHCSFAYSSDGLNYTPAPSTFEMGFKNWKGGRPALYNFGPGDGWVDVDYFRYRYGSTMAGAMR